MRKVSSYTEAEKAQILEEVKTVGNVATVAKNHNIPIGTIYTWVNPKKKKDHSNNKVDCKKLQSKLSECELENQLLKEILKKTYQVWQVG